MEGSREQFRNLRHFIWDFDGTLFDTYPVIIRNLRNALKQFGADADPTEMMGLMLDTIPAAIDFYAARFAIPRDRLQDAYRVNHRQACEMLEAQPMADVADFLRKVCSRGGSNYIFTHRKLTETRAYLEKYGLTELFRDMIGPDSEGFAPKPAPDAVRWLMARNGMLPAETAMIGDRDIDLGSGRNAGVAAIHLVCAAVPQELVCDWRFFDFKEIAAYFD